MDKEIDARANATAGSATAGSATAGERQQMVDRAGIVLQLRRWPMRRWVTALSTAVFTVLVIAIPTDLIDTPFFSRQVPPTVWAWPVLVVSAGLAGLVTATYVAYPHGAAPRRSESRLGLAGGLVTFFAVGCPVCNKIVLLALGTTGALQIFEPIQPYLAGASILLLGWALYARLSRENSCRITPHVPTLESVTDVENQHVQ